MTDLIQIQIRKRLDEYFRLVQRESWLKMRQNRKFTLVQLSSVRLILFVSAATSWLISNEIREVIRAKKYDFKITLALDQFWSLKKMVLERRHGE